MDFDDGNQNPHQEQAAEYDPFADAAVYGSPQEAQPEMQQPPEQPMEQHYEQPAEQPVEQQTEQPVEYPMGQQAEQPMEYPTEQAAVQPVDPSLDDMFGGSAEPSQSQSQPPQQLQEEESASVPPPAESPMSTPVVAPKPAEHSKTPAPATEQPAERDASEKGDKDTDAGEDTEEKSLKDDFTLKIEKDVLMQNEVTAALKNQTSIYDDNQIKYQQFLLDQDNDHQLAKSMLGQQADEWRVKYNEKFTNMTEDRKREQKDFRERQKQCLTDKKLTTWRKIRGMYREDKPMPTDQYSKRMEDVIAAKAAHEEKMPPKKSKHAEETPETTDAEDDGADIADTPSKKDTKVVT